LNSPSYRFAQVESTVEELKIAIERLWSKVAALCEMTEIVTRLSEEVTQLRADISVLKEWDSLPFDSRIISGFPKIFTEFQEKRFSFL
jgi:uncharacterized protein (UPF0335 family)